MGACGFPSKGAAPPARFVGCAPRGLRGALCCARKLAKATVQKPVFRQKYSKMTLVKSGKNML
ncbi:hypothetical protein D7X33_07635 [Butyricicoccus sp. 1XD8-22]|nr:hypothetical protein D7X33_07635 [Butyricicoccus sp. 1XD8-22]